MPEILAKLKKRAWYILLGAISLIVIIFGLRSWLRGGNPVWQNPVVQGIAYVLLGILALIVMLIITLTIGQTFKKKNGDQPTRGTGISGYYRRYRVGLTTNILFVVILITVWKLFEVIPNWKTWWEKQQVFFVVLALLFIYMVALRLRRWGTFLLGATLIILLSRYFVPPETWDKWQQQAEVAKAEREAVALRPVSAREGSRTIEAPVGEWSEPMIIPIGCRSHIRSLEAIEVKTKDGKVRPAGPGHETDWWGDNLANSVKQFRSLTNHPVTVTVVWEPK